MSAMDGDNQANTGANKRTNSRARLKALARRQAAKRSFTTAPALTLALLAAPFAMMGRAEAACAPVAPVSNTTVTCSGANVSYGTAVDNNNMINVIAGATVSDAINAIVQGSGLTLHNDGSITSTVANGVQAGGGLT